MKKIMIIWTIIAVILVGGLTYLGLNIKNQNKPYITFQNELKKQAEKLIGEKPTIISNKEKLTSDDFEENGYNINSYVNGNKCEYYISIEKNMGFYNFKPFIKCSNYQTKGYKN